MVALETFVNVISLGITFVRIHLVGQAFYQNATLDKATRSMCMYSRVFSLNLSQKLPNPNPKKNITQPKNSSYQTTPDYNNLVESNIFRFHQFFIEILFCQEFWLAEFRLFDKKTNFASKMAFFILKFSVYFYRRLSKKRPIVWQTNNLFNFNVLRALKFRVRNLTFFIRTS